MFRVLFISALLSAAPKNTLAPTALTWSPPPSTDDDRPVIATATVTPQGTDYVLKLEFDKLPYGEACGNRCANSTLFLDTDNSKDTGLKLPDTKAPETGADLAITIQGVRALKDEGTEAMLKVLVRQFAEDATALDQGSLLGELDNRHDSERVTVSSKTVSVLIDANLGNQPSGAKMRLVYHPPQHDTLFVVTPGLTARTSGKVELYKGNKLANPAKSPKK